jgi:hypothetical protein
LLTSLGIVCCARATPDKEAAIAAAKSPTNHFGRRMAKTFSYLTTLTKTEESTNASGNITRVTSYGVEKPNVKGGL